MTKKPVNMKLDDKLIADIDKIVELESKRTGYKVSKTALIEKVLKEFVAKYQR